MHSMKDLNASFSALWLPSREAADLTRRSGPKLNETRLVAELILLPLERLATFFDLKLSVFIQFEFNLTSISHHFFPVISCHFT